MRVAVCARLDLFAEARRAGEDVDRQLLVLVLVRRLAPHGLVRLRAMERADRAPRR
jgi:hypothetical protein